MENSHCYTGRGEADNAVGSFIPFPRQVGESVLLSLSRNGMFVLKFYVHKV